MTYDCLIVNGDSYSAPIMSLCEPAPPDDEFPVWPDHLAKNLNLSCHNLSVVGCSNKRILRSTIEFLESDAMLGKKPFVIIAWSFLTRQEIWYSGNNKKLLARAPDNSDRDQDSNLKFITLDWLLETKEATDYHKNLITGGSDELHKTIVDFYTDVFLLINYLKYKTIDYFFFSGASNIECNPYWFKPATDLHLCYQVLNDPCVKHFHDFSLANWAKENDPNCSNTLHLSLDGHKNFSRVIRNFLPL